MERDHHHRLSQDNPLKAVAEFVENSIDAGARSITITRGRERGEHFLEVADDGRGVPRDSDGMPDFRYVATHICDSIKRRLKSEGARGIQGEFGIGLLSFWTVGEELAVEPRQFGGELLHHLPVPASPLGEIYAELYLAAPDPANDVGLYRSGTRILGSIAGLEAFRKPPWTSGMLQGIVDAPFLNLTPATRTGVIHDAALESLAEALAPLESRLMEVIEERNRAEEERSSRDTMRAIQRAFREAMLGLPAEDYDWFDVSGRRGAAASGPVGERAADESVEGVTIGEAETPVQRQFFEFAGPLHSVRIAPAVCTVAVNASRKLHALARDASRRPVVEGVEYAWRIVEGQGRLEEGASEFAVFHAADEPGLVRIAVMATQGETVCEAEAVVTVTDSLVPEEARERGGAGKGLPGYTLEHDPGRLWRSRYDDERNLIVVNSGHRDYAFASRSKALKLRYLVRLFAKEVVRRNFPELRGEELLDRLIELSLHVEENLR